MRIILKTLVVIFITQCLPFVAAATTCNAPVDNVSTDTITTAINQCKDVLQDAVQFNQTDQKNAVLATLDKLETMLVISNQMSDSKTMSELTLVGMTAQDAAKQIDEQQAEQKKGFMAMKTLQEMKDTASTERLIPVWRGATFTYQFYAGVEYGQVGDFFDDSKLRLGFQSYVRLADSFNQLRQKAKNKEADVDGFGLYYPHLLGNVVLTGAAESGGSLADENNNEAGEGEENTSSVDFDAIEFEAALYFPFYMSLSNIDSVADYREMTAGLILTAGGRKVDDVPSFYDRYYVGARLSHNEETYFDVLYGKSEPLTGKRLEIRGQLPVASIGSGRVFLGGIANIEISKSESTATADTAATKEEDSFKVYITWQTSFSDLFKSFTSPD